MANHSIAIVGAGFSGTLMALHLMHRSPPGTRIVLIERNAPFGPGLAYSTGNPNHLLNVPAGRMSAFEDRPRDFLEWLERQPALVLDGVEPTEAAFVPRRLFGAYLRHLLNVATLSQTPNRLELVQDSVLAIEHDSDGLELRFASGRFMRVDRAVLATGNQRPEPVPVNEPSFYDSALWHPDPWAPNAFTDLSPEAPLLLIGTGLTMVDAVIALLDQGHAGPIHAVSRRGLVPRAHTAPTPAGKAAPLAYPSDIAKLTRLLRQRVARAVAAGHAWQSEIDALRPATQALWRTMPEHQRARFLRHLRPWWDVHRHRMPQPIATRIDDALSRGQLRIHAGRICGYEITDRMVDVRFRPRGNEQTAVLRVARVVNCTGPATCYERITDPLVQHLVTTGLARADALGLALDVTDECALLSRAGEASQRMFAVGPLTKGAFWEITAVPDIRRQSAALATHLSRSMQEPSRILHHAA